MKNILILFKSLNASVIIGLKTLLEAFRILRKSIKKNIAALFNNLILGIKSSFRIIIKEVGRVLKAFWNVSRKFCFYLIWPFRKIFYVFRLLLKSLLHLEYLAITIIQKTCRFLALRLFDIVLLGKIPIQWSFQIFVRYYYHTLIVVLKSIQFLIHYVSLEIINLSYWILYFITRPFIYLYQCVLYLFKMLWNGIYWTLQSIWMILAWPFIQLYHAFLWLSRGISGFFKWLCAWISRIAEAVWNALLRIAKVVWNILSWVAAWIWMMLAWPFIQIYNGLVWLSGFLNNFFQWLGELICLIAKALGEFVFWIFRWIWTIFVWPLRMLFKVLCLISDSITRMFEFLKDLSDAIVEKLSEYFDVIYKILKETVHTIGQLILYFIPTWIGIFIYIFHGGIIYLLGGIVYAAVLIIIAISFSPSEKANIKRR